MKLYMKIVPETDGTDPIVTFTDEAFPGALTEDSLRAIGDDLISQRETMVQIHPSIDAARGAGMALHDEFHCHIQPLTDGSAALGLVSKYTYGGKFSRGRQIIVEDFRSEGDPLVFVGFYPTGPTSVIEFHDELRTLEIVIGEPGGCAPEFSMN